MKNRTAITVILGLSIALICFSCGENSENNSSSSSTSEPGSDLNESGYVQPLNCEGTITGGTFTDGFDLASVYIADGEMSTCINVIEDPTFKAVTSLPDGFDLNTSEGDTNVTKGGTAYTYLSNGTRGFTTTTDDAVTITLPFNNSTIPAEDLTSTKIFIRLLDIDSNAVVNLTGTLSATNDSIAAETRGLPVQFTAAVIYNPNMDAVLSDAASSLIISASSTRAMATSWPAEYWCIVYNSASEMLKQAVWVKEDLTGYPTAAQIRDCVYQNVAGAAIVAQEKYYQPAGFREPNLFIGKTKDDPCGSTVTAPRYFIHLSDKGSEYTSDEVIGANQNRYGRIYINSSAISNPRGTGPGEPGSVKAAVAHEIFHAVQQSYFNLDITTLGYGEGSATTYGISIDQGTVATPIVVRSYVPGETFHFSNSLTINNKSDTGEGGEGDPDELAYSNQDFFAYVARKYNSNSLAYLAGLFEQMRTEIEAEAAQWSDPEVILEQPPRTVLFKAMDTYFYSAFGYRLKEVYMDFLKQRVFEHNTESQFGRTGETTSGFASDLFDVGSSQTTQNSVTVAVDPSNCSLTDGSGSFSQITPLAARVINITAIGVSTAETPPMVSIELTPDRGAWEESLSGYCYSLYSYNLGLIQPLTAGTNEFPQFGESLLDNIKIVFANVEWDIAQDEEVEITTNYKVACKEASEDSTSSFTFSTYNLPDEATMSPSYIVVGEQTDGKITAIVATTNDQTMIAYEQNVTIYFNTGLITGSGTYTIGSDPMSDAVAMQYSPGSLALTSGTSYSFASSGGSAVLSSYGKSTGDHIRGSFTANMAAIGADKTGTLAATFDFVVGSANEL